MKILVTGGSGFMGKCLCSRLKERGNEIIEINSRTADLREPGSLDRYNSTRFDRIFHLAAWTQAGDFCRRHPGEQWIINQQINTNMLAWWQARQPEAKIIAIGTSCSYAPGNELREENYLAGTPLQSFFSYAMTKRMLYSGLIALNEQFGMKYLHVIPSTLYGPNYHTDGRQLHFIFDLIRKIIRGKYHNDPVTLWGDGSQKRELIYIEDFVSLLLRLDQGTPNESVNIGGGEEFTIREFASLICAMVGYDFERIGFDTSRHVGAASKILAIDKLRSLLGEVSFTPLKEGLEKTVSWMLSQQHNAMLFR